MSASATNQAQMRSATLSGSPKKKAAWLSLSNIIGGIRPGTVITCQKANSASSRPTCHNHKLPPRGLMKFHMASGRFQLLLVTLEHLFAQHLPDGPVQLQKAR